MTTLPEKLERLGILVNIITVVLIVFTIYGIKVPIILDGKFIVVNMEKRNDYVLVKFYSNDAMDITKNNKNVLLSGMYGENHKMPATVINSSIRNNELTLDLQLKNGASLLGSAHAGYDRHARLFVGKKSLLFTLFRLTE